jgi:DNA-binding NtrC family response regulator
MRYPQIILYEADASIAQILEPIVQARRWVLRHPRQAPACLALVEGGGPAVLVLKIGRHLIREMTFLDQVHEGSPDVPLVVVADSEDYLLLRLSMELGASFVLMPPQSRQDLVEVVTRLLETTIQRMALAQPNVAATPITSLDLPMEEPPLGANA